MARVVLTLLGGLLLAVGTVVAAVAVLVCGAVAGLCDGVWTFVKHAHGILEPDAGLAHLRIEPGLKSRTGRDPAYRGYLTGPVFREYQWLWRTGCSRLFKDFRWECRNRTNRWMVEYRSAPLAVVAFLGFVSTVPLSWALLAATAVVHLLLIGLVAGAALVVLGSAWLFESTVLLVRRISTECGRCHQRMARPEFRCPCGAQHRNLMPGAQGVFRRTCRCGQDLPTLLVLGKRNLMAQCRYCAARLPGRPQSTPTFHLPVVGGMAAGKSVFMHTAVARLNHERLRYGFDFADADALHRYEQAQDLLQDAALSRRTPVSQPVAYHVHLGAKSSRRLLYLYDAAGEVLQHSHHLVQSAFLQLTDGVIFIVDPFALTAVRHRTDAGTLHTVRASEADPKAVLDGLVQTLQEHRRTNRSARLALRAAVVITKADALLSVPEVRHPYRDLSSAESTRAGRSAAARQWLLDHGRADLVNSLHNHFQSVMYFTVTYLDVGAVLARGPATHHDPVTNDDPATPILWLVSGRAEP